MLSIFDEVALNTILVEAIANDTMHRPIWAPAFSTPFYVSPALFKCVLDILDAF